MIPNVHSRNTYEEKKVVLLLSAAIILAGFGMVMFGLFWAPEINLIFVIGGAAIAAVGGYLLIDEMAHRNTD